MGKEQKKAKDPNKDKSEQTGKSAEAVQNMHGKKKQKAKDPNKDQSEKTGKSAEAVQHMHGKEKQKKAKDPNKDQSEQTGKSAEAVQNMHGKEKQKKAKDPNNDQSEKSRPKEGQRPEETQKQNIAKPARATSVNTEVAVTAIQSAWRSSQHQCADKAKKVNVQEMVENSDEAQSSVHQAHGQTGKKKKAAPKGGGNKNMMKKEGKGDAVQKKGPDARDAAAGTNQDPSISTPREGQRPEEEQQQNIAKPACATSVNTEVAVTAIQSASKSSQHQCADKAKRVNVQEMV